MYVAFTTLREFSGTHGRPERLCVGETAAATEIHRGVIIEERQAHLVLRPETPLQGNIVIVRTSTENKVSNLTHI